MVTNMRPRQFSDQELYQVARRCFLEHGPGVSTSTIAAELGVSPPALFRRVRTKDELLRRALSLPVYPEWIEHVEAGPDDRPLREQLLALAQEMDAFFRSMAPALATLRASGISKDDLFAQFEEPPPVRALRALGGWFAAASDDANVDTSSLAIAFMGCLQARHMTRHLLGDCYPDGGPGYLETVVDVFVSGLTSGGSR